MGEIESSAAKAIVPAKVKEAFVAVVSEVSAADALMALTKIIDVVKVHQVEATKREKLRVYETTEVARINASKEVLKDYFDRVFKERESTYKKFFESLDVALESGDAAAVQIVVGGIVEVARQSPLANLGNLAELRAALDDPDTVFEF
jgi:trehalose/maltose hydrolase-like predicted phosphorylase